MRRGLKERIANFVTANQAGSNADTVMIVLLAGR